MGTALQALKHVSLCPTAITKIARSVVVFISMHNDPDWRSWRESPNVWR